MAWRITTSRWWRVFRPLFSFFGVFFEMVRRRLHLEVRIRFSLLYPRSGGATSTGGRRVELCVRRIFSDLVRFCVRSCGFRSGYSDLRLSSLAMVAALLRWSFRVLARRLPVWLLQQALLRQDLPGSSEEGVRTAARLRLASLIVVIARWSKDLFVIFITFGILYTVVDNQ